MSFGDAQPVERTNPQPLIAEDARSRAASQLSTPKAPARYKVDGPRVLSCAVVGLVLCVVAMWMLQHPYMGLINDATLYALGAFARLHPGSLGHDIFLSHGSQNGYTLFSPLVAPLMRQIGVGRAASVVTLISQLLFFGVCAWLARRLMSASLLILSMALLVALPSLYGPGHIFSFTECLMTPRVASEALVMAALAFALMRRHVVMTLCLLAGVLLHPIMALAGIVFLYFLFVGMRRPWLTAGLVGGGLAVLEVLSRMAPFGPLAMFGPQWFHFLHDRMQYLFPSLWSVPSWSRAAIPGSTLIVGAVMLESHELRGLCRAALATASLGLAISLIGADLSHIVIVAQAQTWRWLWLSNVLAIMLLPAIGFSCWRRGAAGRATLLLVAAAWVSFELPLGGLVALGAAGVAAAARFRRAGRESPVFLGAALLVLIASLFFFGLSLLPSMGRPAAAPAGLTFFQSMFWAVATKWLPWASGGVIPICGFLALWSVAVRPARERRSAGLLVLMAGLTTCVALVPFAWSAWSNFTPSKREQAQFAPWRRAIPPSSQVLAPAEPIVPWFDLERPSYWSRRQMSGAVFSRSATLELLRRQNLLRRLRKSANPQRVLDSLCAADRSIGFIVSRVDRGPTPFKVITLGRPSPGAALRLYSCKARRGHPTDVSQPTVATHRS